MIKLINSLVYSAFVFLIIMQPSIVFAAVEKKATSVDAFSMMSMLNMVMGLVVVVALILGLSWVLKKYGRLPNNNLVDMKVLGGLSLGTREKALLIEVENTRLLVGVTPGHIQTLHILDDVKKSTTFNETLNKIVDKNSD